MPRLPSPHARPAPQPTRSDVQVNAPTGRFVPIRQLTDPLENIAKLGLASGDQDERGSKGTASGPKPE